MTLNEDVRFRNRWRKERLRPCCHANVLDNEQRGTKLQFMAVWKQNYSYQECFLRFPKAFNQQAPFIFNRKMGKKNAASFLSFFPFQEIQLWLSHLSFHRTGKCHPFVASMQETYGGGKRVVEMDHNSIGFNIFFIFTMFCLAWHVYFTNTYIPGSELLSEHHGA